MSNARSRLGGEMVGVGDRGQKVEVWEIEDSGWRHRGGGQKIEI
jgi:hypothetical protein